MTNLEGSETLPGASEDLLAIFIERFPLVNQLEVNTALFENPKSIPGFLYFILSAAVSDNRLPICFLVPDRKQTAYLAAILLTLSQIKLHFKEWAIKYARSFKVGTRVRVKPTDDVFEFGGVWDEFPGKFRLNKVGSKDSRSFDIHEVLRLEKTPYKIPKGKFDCAFPPVKWTCALDDLLGVKSYDNKSIFDCLTFLFSSQSNFAEFLESWELNSKGQLGTDIRGIISIGSIDRAGVLRCDAHSASMDLSDVNPLIASSSRSMNLLHACRDSFPFSKTVFVESARRLTNNLQAYDYISESQKLLILADHSELFEVKQLADRGCLVWDLSREELAFGLDSGEVPISLCPSSVTSSAQYTRITLRNNNLQCLNALLLEIQEMISTLDETSMLSVREHVQKLFYLLIDLSNIASGDFNCENLKKLLNQCTDRAKQESAFILPEIFALLLQCFDLFGQEITRIEVEGSQKQHWLKTYIENHELGGSVVVALRHPSHVSQMQSWLKSNGLSCGCLPLSELANECHYSEVIVTGWPGRNRWRKISGLLSTGKILFLGYSFEQSWLASFQKSEDYMLDGLRMTDAQKSEYIDIDSDSEKLFASKSSACVRFDFDKKELQQVPLLEINEGVQSVRKDADIFFDQSEAETREARYVSFVGSSYAYLTDGCHLPLLTEFYESRNRQKSAIKSVSGRTIARGDILLFREHGDPDILKAVSKEIAGSVKYEELRKVANEWRVALHRSGVSPSFAEYRLKEIGLERQSQTINLWLTDPDLIGPTSPEDIEKIAILCKDSNLESRASIVANAIRDVRTLHQQAGRKLTEMLLQNLPESPPDGEQEISFEFIVAHIVEVENVEECTRRYPSTYVNKLRRNN